MDRHNDIVAQSVASFTAVTGISLVVDDNERISFINGGVPRQFSYSVVKSITTPKASSREQIAGESHLLISDYISNPARIYLKEHDVNYLDTAGNTFLKIADRLLIYVETGKSARFSPTPKGRAFTKAGLRVVYQFLTHDTVNLSYREIGELAGVSIDTVSKTVKDLLSSSYLIETNSKVYEVDKQDDLVETWVTAYNRVLRPRLKSAYFTFGRDAKPYDLARNCPPDTLGGELAADTLGTDLIGERATLYTEQPFHALARAVNLVPVGRDSPVEIVRQFWTNSPHNNPTVNPLLVYADLRYRPTPRNLAAAAQLYETHVRPTLQRAT